ncbi:hypothetical protein pb186bvf_007659 [Paramecium bursaria]
MWLRLAYLQLPRAFNRQIVNGRHLKQDISGRYKALLRKQFYIHGVPWIYDAPKTDDKNPRHKKPKGHKNAIIKQERVEKIRKNIQDARAEEHKYRQERLNGRPLSGMDRIIQKSLPSWLSSKEHGSEERIKFLTQEQKEQIKKEREQQKKMKEDGLDDF